MSGKLLSQGPEWSFELIERYDREIARIAGTGSHLPERVMTTADLEAVVETSDAWIRERTGICSRRVVSDGETTVSLGEAVCRKALEAADVDPAETAEWLESLEYVIQNSSPDRVRELLEALQSRVHYEGIKLPFSANTPYWVVIFADVRGPRPSLLRNSSCSAR